MKRERLDGLRFGKLMVVSDCEELDSRGFKIKVNCICDCGNKCSVAKASLKGSKKNGTSTKSCGCLKKTHFIDLTGNKYNHLTVSKYLGKDNYKNNIYESTCDCGGTIITQGSDIKVGKIKSCGCYNFSKQNSKCVERGLEPVMRNLFAGYKRDRGYPFELTFDEFKELIKQNCHYCGSVPKNVKTDRRVSGEKVLIYNGIDRVNNDIGYLTENVVPCCRSCNIAKHTYSIEFFKELITNIYHNFVVKVSK